MPIPWTVIHDYARSQGVRGRGNLNHFCRLVMAVDEEFRAAVNERMEEATKNEKAGK